MESSSKEAAPSDNKERKNFSITEKDKKDVRLPPINII